MSRLSMALTELAERGADADVLREIRQFVTQRMMDLGVEGPLRSALRRARRAPRDRLGATRHRWHFAERIYEHKQRTA
jgi:hypothetical protein